MTLLLPAVASAQDSAQRKYLNIKSVLGYSHFYPGEEDGYCSDPNRLEGSFGIQIARVPWQVDVSFLTHIGFEIQGSAWLPLWDVPRGKLMGSLGLVFISTLEHEVEYSELGCKRGSLREMNQTLGVGGALEYLLFQGDLGFFVEFRQAFLNPLMTWVGIGVDVSPLLWLRYSND